MPPTDLEGLVKFITALIGNIWSNWGDAWQDGATNPLYMWVATKGAFGENGGLFYWWNSKLLWLIEQMLAGLGFTTSP